MPRHNIFSNMVDGIFPFIRSWEKEKKFVQYLLCKGQPLVFQNLRSWTGRYGEIWSV